jgi:ATP-dependent DNA helicase RecG
VGIALARKELEKNGNPPVEFKIEDTYVLAILRRRT